MDVLVAEKKFSGKEVAVLLGISRTTWWRIAKAGKVKYYQLGARRLYGESHVREFLESVERHRSTR